MKSCAAAVLRVLNGASSTGEWRLVDKLPNLKSVGQNGSFTAWIFRRRSNWDELISKGSCSQEVKLLHRPSDELLSDCDDRKGPVELANDGQLDDFLIRSWKRRSNKTKLAERYGVVITVKLAKCLAEGVWLNSEVITFFLEDLNNILLLLAPLRVYIL